MFCTATNRAIVLIISFTFSAAIIHDVCGFTPICKHFWARRLPIGKIVSRCNYHPTRCMSVQKRSSAPSVKAKIQRGALALGDTRSFASLGDIGDILQESNSEENNTNLEWKQQLLQKYRGLMAFWQQNFFIVGMAIGVTLSKLNPSLGVTGTTPERILSKYGVFLVFFLSGLSLQLRDLKASLLDLRLNLLIQLWSLVVWPCLIGLPTIATLRSCVASNRYPLLSKFLPTQQLLDGILITTCLPTTINMCVFLSSAANANVATALCNAILGNLLGIFVTPAWLLHFFGGSTTKNQGPLIELPFPTMVSKLCAKVLLPVSVGQSLRGMPKIQDWYKSHSQFFKRASEVRVLNTYFAVLTIAFDPPTFFTASFSYISVIIHLLALSYRNCMVRFL